MTSALVLSGSVSLTFAPAARSALIVSTLSLARREQQRRPAEDRSVVDVRARLDQQLHRRGVAFVRGPHQRRLLLPAFLGVDVGAVRQQHLHGVDLAGAGRRHQRRLAFRQRRVRIRAGLEQLLDHRRVAVDGGGIQRRHAVAIRGLDVGSRANQQLRRGRIVTVRRPVQRRRPVGLADVHRARLLQERADRRGVPAA